MRWQFWIDVGGTFTDCIARAPDGHLLTGKTLSSGRTPGQIAQIVDDQTFIDPARSIDPPGFWIGAELRLLDASANLLQSTRVTDFDPNDGRLRTVDVVHESVSAGSSYELDPGLDAPILAIRHVLGLSAEDPLPPLDVRIGTTRGTNALLERKGARTAFVTTRGFADVLLIANQDRPRLFDLAIVKPLPLFTAVVEIDERLDSAGAVLRAPDEDRIRQKLAALQEQGIESLAICLLHSFANSCHEELVEQIARDVGFEEISTSSRLAPLIKIVSRGDTTVVDAYINPVLRRYVDRLRSATATNAGDASTLKLMTSAGGLVDANQFVGKDSILSGPAGGVIGFSRVAEQAGFAKSIGFDMGGTSTDVARYDGRYEMEYETQKSGVRIVAPMMAIETVAAGGGSICDFDGVKLVVGPESAGADPGPACYGRGGPLTITDVNVALGRVLPERFPFPLDVAAVEHRLRDLCERVGPRADDACYSPIELAQGFADIANTNMVRAIRRISVERGYDPADYALVTFGGAGAQHACAIARMLGIRRVLVHPLAGILSAYGMGLADVRRFAEQAVLQPYGSQVLAALEVRFREMEQRATDAVLADGIPRERIATPIRSLDLRYVGLESVITIEQPPDGDYAAAYEEQHQQRFGYRREGRGLEIAAARVEVLGSLEPPELPAAPMHSRRPASDQTVTTHFGGQALPTAVFDRADLQPGDEIDGPAIVCEPTSTVVIEPGFQATVLSRGELQLTDRGDDSKGSGWRATAQPDPVLLEIFNNLIASVAEQMGVTLQKTSISTNVKERLDFSCAVFDAGGGLVCNAPHIPVHLGAMSETVKAIIADNPDIQPGDVFVTNDPYRGGSHLPDVTVVTPVHEPDTGRLIFWTASRAHHAEIGGIVPGSMPPFSRTLADEGVLIRNLCLVAAGASHEEQLRALLSSGPHPSRNVDDNLDDVAAQVAANATGVRLLRDLIQRYSLPVVEAYMQRIQQAASVKMRLALSQLDDGTYSLADSLDNGAVIKAAVMIQGDQAIIDFTGTGPVLDSNLNANRAIVTAAVLYVFRCLINEDIPLNSGVLEPVQIVLPECLLNPPAHDDPRQCAAIAGGNVETSQRVVDVLLGALGLAAASQGTMNNLTFGDAEFGYYETICGGSGATPNAAGADAVHTHMTNTRLTDVEVIERRYPVRIHEFAIRRGSGGKGLYSGGDGIVRRVEFLRPLQVSMLSQRRGAHVPFGLNGGAAGQPGRNTLRRAGSTQDEDLGGCFQITVQPGDVLTIETPGGGGYGASTDNEIM